MPLALPEAVALWWITICFHRAERTRGRLSCLRNAALNLESAAGPQTDFLDSGIRMTSPG